MDFDVKEKLVVVTGGAQGLGLAILTSFLNHGAKLVISLDIDETEGNKSVDALKQQYGEKAVFYKCNVLTDLDKSYDTIVKNHQKVDILINCAGIVNEKSIRKTIEINTIALMEWSIKFYDHMRRDKGGKGGAIINISSFYGFSINPYCPYYHASKFAVIGFSRSLGHAINFENSGVRILTLCPGFTRTRLINNPIAREDENTSKFLEFISDSEWQDPKDVGEASVEVYQKADSGTIWLVDGGKLTHKVELYI